MSSVCLFYFLSIIKENLSHIYGRVYFSVPYCDVITHQKTKSLEYVCLKSNFGITYLEQNELCYAE